MDFVLPPELEVIHQPARLRIVTALHREGDLGLRALRQMLGLSGGNLASHLDKLDAAGIVRQDRIFSRLGLEVRILLTTSGRQRFADYLALLRRYLESQPREGWSRRTPD